MWYRSPSSAPTGPSENSGETPGLHTWLYGIVLNQARSDLRQRAVRSRRERASFDDPVQSDDESLLGELRSQEESAVERIEKRERDAKVQECIGSLEGEQREVLVLRDIQGFSYEEIGVMLKLPEGTVKSRLFRARSALKDGFIRAFGDLKMTCKEIEDRLPAYLEDFISPEEKEMIKGHLAVCSRCGRAVADLKRADELVRNLGEVEPAALLRTEDHVPDQGRVRTKKGLLRRLFYPLHIKVPIQALASVLIAVIGFYVYQTGEPEMKQLVSPHPALHGTREGSGRCRLP